MINGMRFVIGNKCNYNCFYCHHEGIFEEQDKEEFKNKIDMIYRYCEKYNINHLSITGGEPLIYEKKFKYILNKFNNKKFKFSINTNATLIDRYIDYLKDLNCSIEFHTNVSSLERSVHEYISGSKLYNKLFENLQMLKTTKHKICLNTILLKNVNDSEIYKFLDFCKENGFVLRLLQYLPSSAEDKKYVISEKELDKYIHGVEVGEINSYGVIPCCFDDYKFEFVKNLCCDKLCERCKQHTYVHFTPEMNIKMCMMSGNVQKVNYDNFNSLEETFNNL